MKKIILIPGVRFHSEIYLDLYRKIFDNPKIFICTSSPKSKFINKNFTYIFIPFFFKILLRILNKSESNFFKKIDQKLFSFFSTIVIYLIKPDIIHSWGGIASSGFNISKSNKKILERSSTYLPLQLKILRKESKKIGLNKKIYPSDINTFYEELNLSSKIIVPSKYVYDNYPKRYQNKLAIIYPFSNKIYAYGYKKYNKKKKIMGYVGGNAIIKGLIYLYYDYINLDNNFLLWLKIDENNLNSIPIHLKNLILNNKNIIICGSKMNMEYFYKSLDVLLQPSLDDGFNMTTVEALSCGVPTYINRNMGSVEFLKKLTPKNIFNLQEKKSLHRVLTNMNIDNLKRDSLKIKQNFDKQFQKFNLQNYLSFRDLIEK